MTEEAFQAFLSWIGSDAEKSGERYNELRSGLARMFAARGCDRPDDLADATLDRVIRKVDVVAPGYQGNPAAYVHGVAKKVFLEYLRSRQRVSEIGGVELEAALRRVGASAEDAELERRHACLERCLAELEPEERELILRYYSEERWAKIEQRQQLAADSRLSRTALRKRTQRTRERLKSCLMRRLEESES